MIASPDIKTPEQYFASLAEPRRSDVRALHEAICKAIPKHKPEMIAGLLGYGKYRYKYESGREGDTGVVMVASQKQYISLYLGCVGEDGYLAEKNKHRLGKVSVGKCCIRFKKLADIDLKVAMELVQETAKQLRKAAEEIRGVMRHATALVCVLAVNFLTPCAGAEDAPPRHPFPQHTKYAAGSVLPLHVTQAQRDDAALVFYRKWKAKYLAPSRTAGNFFVLVDEEEKGKGPLKIAVSEGHGYGMLIAAFMAGGEPQAHEIFDGLWRYARAHPSKINPRLMAWQQVTGERTLSDDEDSATDGDLDIAQALLLADAQWGSAGAVNYRDEARTLIAAIKKDEINAKTWTAKLGDWADAQSPMFFTTRTSDFMPGHFRSFQRATDDADWGRVIENGYKLVDGLQSRFAAKTGLLPDFVITVDRDPRPPKGKHLEGKHDGHYSYNACRVPLRVGLDFLLHGESRAKAALMPMNAWLKTATGGKPERIVAGYDLAGKIFDRDDRSMAFTACFGVGAMCDATHQEWLNALWDHIVASDSADDRYYARTLKMLCLIAMSGNWWSTAE